MIKATLTVEQDDHTGHTVFSVTARYGADNPIFYADEVRTMGLALAMGIAKQLETLYPATTTGARDAGIRKLVADLGGMA